MDETPAEAVSHQGSPRAESSPIDVDPSDSEHVRGMLYPASPRYIVVLIALTGDPNLCFSLTSTPEGFVIKRK